MMASQPVGLERPCLKVLIGLVAFRLASCFSFLQHDGAAAGAPLPGQINTLRNGCDIAVGTPGRVQDLMQRSGSLKLDKIR